MTMDGVASGSPDNEPAAEPGSTGAARPRRRRRAPPNRAAEETPHRDGADDMAATPDGASASPHAATHETPAAFVDGASGPYAWAPPDDIVSGQNAGAPAAAEEGNTDARLQLRQVQGDRGRPARRR